MIRVFVLLMLTNMVIPYSGYLANQSLRDYWVSHTEGIQYYLWMQSLVLWGFTYMLYIRTANPVFDVYFTYLLIWVLSFILIGGIVSMVVYILNPIQNELFEYYLMVNLGIVIICIGLYMISLKELVLLGYIPIYRM